MKNNKNENPLKNSRTIPKISKMSKTPNFVKHNYFKSELSIRDHLITETRRKTLAYVSNPQEELSLTFYFLLF